MSFLDNVTTTTRAPSPLVKKRGFLGGVSIRTEQEDRIREFEKQYQIARANAEFADSLAGNLTEIGREFIDIGKKGFEGLMGGFKKAGEAGGEVGTALREGKTPEAVAGGLRLASGIAEASFAPISAAFAMAEEVPLLKPAVNVLSLPFVVTGAVGQFAGDKFTDALPISDEAKEILRPAFEEVGSLAGQIILGAKVMHYIAKKKPVEIKTTDLTPEAVPIEVRKVFPEVPETKIPIRRKEVTRVPVKGTAREVPIDVRTPYIPPEKLPVIQYGGPKRKSALPMIDFDTGEFVKVVKRAKDEAITYVPLEIPKAKIAPSELSLPSAPRVRGGFLESSALPKPVRPMAPRTPRVQPPKAPKEVEVSPELKDVGQMRPFEPAETGGETFIPKLARSIEAKAIEKKLVETLGELPELNRVNMKEQAELASQFIAKESERAKRVAMGDELPPSNILPEVIHTAIEELAFKTGDIELMRELATSRLTTEASAMGQRIRALGERDQASPTRIIRDVQKARETSFEKKSDKSVSEARREVVNEIKTEMKKSASKRPSWEEFINEIKCNF